MDYTIKKLANMAGISTRTLRYYDEINLLKPKEINVSGYRIYGEKEVKLLQHILFYREFGIELEEIRKMIHQNNFNELEVLENHYKKLIDKKKNIDKLIRNISRTIDEKKGGKKMKDSEKFEGFKQKMIDENEQKYGKEIREKYGNDTINESNKKFAKMTQEEYEEVTKLGEEILEKLDIAFEEGNPESELAREVAELHKKWITFYWSSYTKEAHVGVANMYVADERFAEYYEKKHKGAAKFLRDAIVNYIEKN